MQSSLHIFAVSRVLLCSGDRYWELSGNRVLRRFGRHLSELGLPPHTVSVDAAFVWGHHRRVYLVTGRTYWRLDDSGQTVLIHGYPRDVAGVWHAVQLPIDAAFTDADGHLTQLSFAFCSNSQSDYHHRRREIVGEPPVRRHKNLALS